MGSEGETANLLLSEVHVTWEPGYETAAKAAARTLALPPHALAPQEGPVLHFGALPKDMPDLPPLGEQGYLLCAERTPHGPTVRCLGRTPQGAFYALRELRKVWEGKGVLSLPLNKCLASSPAFPHRGISEASATGWAWETRKQLLAFAARHQLDHYLYAPEDDLYRTVHWREPYALSIAEKLREFLSQAHALFINVIYSLQPNLDPDDPFNREALEAKCRQVLEMGAKGIALLSGAGQHDPEAWGRLINWLLGRLRDTHPQVKLWTGLSTTSMDRPSGTPLHELAQALAPEAELLWPGPDLVNRQLTQETASTFVEYIGRKPWLLEHYPDNRFAPYRLFLGPYEGHDPGLTQRLHGVTAVAMQQALASQIPLATIADFLWDPESYDPEASWERALQEIGRKTAKALRQFAGLNRSSILNHQEDEDLEMGLAAWELEGLHGYLARKLLALEDALGSLGPLGNNRPLMEEIAPWLEKAGYLVQTAARALELSHSLRTTRKEAPSLYEQTVLGLGRSRQLPHIVAPFRLDRFAVRVLRQAEVKLGKPLGRIQTTAPKGRDHPWGLVADGDLMTSFRATANLQPGHSVTLDMGTVMQVRWVHLSQGYFYYWPTGCVEEGRLLSSTDGETWKELTRINGPGAWEVDLHLDPPRAIRYVRLVNDASRPWPMVVRQLEVYE